MRLRVYLLLANAVSILMIIVMLLFLYRYMLLSERQFIWLAVASLGAGLLSGVLHFVLVRPVEAAVLQVGEGSTRIAEGDLSARVPIVGPAELKRLASQFNEMGGRLEMSFRQLQAAESVRRELVANMAHDLRTPLASLQAYAEALEDGVVQDESTVRRYMGTIRNESIRLGKLIQQLFEMSTLDASDPSSPESLEGLQVKSQAEVCALEDVLVEVLPRFMPSMEAKSLQLEVALPEQQLVCRIGAEPLGRIIQNVLENAVRYSPSGGKIRIAASLEASGNVHITISDEGEGVPVELRERIFERFYRVDPARSRESGSGAGLGLSIAKSLVQQAGGQIGTGGPGSVFWLKLPGWAGRKEETSLN